MTHPVLKRRSLLVLTALLVVTAGGAAAPMRNVWLPLAARPLALWGNVTLTPAAAKAPLHSTTAAASATNADLDALLTKAPERLDFIAAPLAPPTATRSRGNDATGYSDDSGNANSRRSGNRWFNGNSRRYGGGVGGPSAPYGGGGTTIRQNGSNKGDASSSGSPSSSGNGYSGGGWSGGGGSSLDDLFNEHGSNLAKLTGGLSAGSSPFAPGSAVGSNLASSPEPSTLLLLGTGLAALAGSMRRRLR